MDRKFYALILLGVTCPLVGHGQAYTNRIIYGRATLPNGTIWLNDAAGTDTLLFDNGAYPKVDRDGKLILYLQNTTVSNPAYGGLVRRNSGPGGTDEVVLNSSSDYVAGCDILESDSSYLLAYGCAIYRYAFDGTNLGTVTSASCYGDGPDIRQSDSLVVFHNTQETLFTTALSGGPLTAIPNTGNTDMWSSWSPDGQWILFGRYNSSLTGVINYYRIKPTGEDLMALTLNDPTDTAHFSSNAVWSNDGSRIIVAGYRADGSYGLMSIAADGSADEASITTSPGATITFLSASQLWQSLTGVSETVKAKRLPVWPMPVIDMITVGLPNGSGTWTLALMDAEGRIILQMRPLGATPTMDLSGINPGSYFLRALSSTGSVMVTPVVKI
ncbi:MAG: hypothetical protein ABI373_03825 [Flavobacteriales bacterium]